MPTFKHIPTGKRFFFAHIPRTAGRFIIINLMTKNQCAWDDLHLGQEKMYNHHEGMEIGHFHREYYEKYLKVKDIPHFSIVRNPITRFKSASLYLNRFVGDDVEQVMEDRQSFFSTLKAMIWHYPESANWFRSQVDFVTDKTHVWKFEDGFGDNFTNWLSDTVEVDLTFDKDVQYPKQRDEGNKFNLTSKHIDNIRDYYSEDFAEFYSDQ